MGILWYTLIIPQKGVLCKPLDKNRKWYIIIIKHIDNVSYVSKDGKEIIMSLLWFEIEEENDWESSDEPSLRQEAKISEDEYIVCPSCKGEGCDRCDFGGLVKEYSSSKKKEVSIRLQKMYLT
jgi:hypothetical protein